MSTKLTIEVSSEAYRIYKAQAEREGIPVEALVQSVVEFWPLIPPSEEKDASAGKAPDTCACCGGTAWLSRITICENRYEDKVA